MTIDKDCIAKLDLFLLSDSTGETVCAMAKAVTPLFRDIEIEIHIHPLLRSTASLMLLIDDIQDNIKNNHPSAILFTMADGELSDLLAQESKNRSIPILSVLDPTINFISTITKIEHEHGSLSKYELTLGYYQKLGAINFAIATDDGQNPRSLFDADIVILGASRTSKTPISLYIAQRWGYKVANFPIVLHEDYRDRKYNYMPSNKARGVDVLLDLTSRNKLRENEVNALRKMIKDEKLFLVGLNISPEILKKVRTMRMLNKYSDCMTSMYCEYNEIVNEIATINELFYLLEIPILDVSNRAIEEIAVQIVELFRSRLVQ